MINQVIEATKRIFGGNKKTSSNTAVDPVIAGVVESENIHCLADLVEDMLEDPMVVMALNVFISHLSRTDFTVNAGDNENDPTQEAIEEDVERLVSETLRKLCDLRNGLLTWGGLPFEKEIENAVINDVPLTRIRTLKQLPKHIKGRRATELVLDKDGKFGGIRVTIDDADFVIPPEQSCWLAIGATPLEPYGQSIFFGAPKKVREQRKSVDELMLVFLRRWAIDGETIHAPAMAVDPLTGQPINNHKRLAAAIRESQRAGGVKILPNEPHGGIGMEGKYAIDITHEAKVLDSKPLEIVDALTDAKMARSFGIHESVVMDTETGSYAAQTVRTFMVKAIVDKIALEIFGQLEEEVNKVYPVANNPALTISIVPTSHITDGLMVEMVQEILKMPQWGPLLKSGAIDLATILANAGIPVSADYEQRLEDAYAQIQADEEAARQQQQQVVDPAGSASEADPLFASNDAIFMAAMTKKPKARLPQLPIAKKKTTTSVSDDRPHGGKGSNQYATKGVSKAKQPEQKPKKPRKPEPVLSQRSKSEIAKASMVRVDAPMQRYAENVNELALSQAVEGASLKDNQPVDVVTFADGWKPSGPLSNQEFEAAIAEHGLGHCIEMKTKLVGHKDKVEMSKDSMKKKRKFQRDYGATIHTIAFDDRKVFNAGGEGEHDISQRRMYYRRGFGGFSYSQMYEVTSTEELNKLLNMTKRQLPKGAK